MSNNDVRPNESVSQRNIEVQEDFHLFEDDPEPSNEPQLQTPQISTWEYFQSFTLEETCSFYRVWFFFINIIHLMNLIMVPLMLAWTEHFYAKTALYFYLVLDAFLIADCFFQSRLAYDDEYGTAITDSTSTLKRYLASQNGVLQILASLPVEMLAFTLTEVWFQFSSDGIPANQTQIGYE
jgi:hypothetical protein